MYTTALAVESEGFFHEQTNLGPCPRGGFLRRNWCRRAASGAGWCGGAVKGCCEGGEQHLYRGEWYFCVLLLWAG